MYGGMGAQEHGSGHMLGRLLVWVGGALWRSCHYNHTQRHAAHLLRVGNHVQPAQCATRPHHCVPPLKQWHGTDQKMDLAAGDGFFLAAAPPVGTVKASIKETAALPQQSWS
jgi:hypothetical protein